MVYQTRLYYDMDNDAAANKRHDIIKGMYISGEFPVLVAWPEYSD